jgi:hypothetical protein
VLDFFNPSFLFTRSLHYWVEMVAADHADGTSVIERVAHPVNIARDKTSPSLNVDDDGEDAENGLSESVEQSGNTGVGEVTEF